eukprot:jgi/Hompol1/4250/HPOL_003545-RA
MSPLTIPNTGAAMVDIFGTGFDTLSESTQYVDNVVHTRHDPSGDHPVRLNIGHCPALTSHNLAINSEPRLRVFDFVRHNIKLAGSIKFSQRHLHPNTIYAASQTYSDALVGFVNITAASTPLLPTVSISAPAVIGSCSNLTFDLSDVSGSGGRPFRSISLTFTSSRTSLRDPIVASSIQTAVQAFLSGTNLITIPSATLSSRSYVFTFTITNFLGGTASANVSVVKSSSEIVPVTTVLASGSTLSAGSLTELIAKVSIPQTCLTSSSTLSYYSFTYLWQFVSGGTSGFTYTIPATSASQLYVKIPPYTFAPSTLANT